MPTTVRGQTWKANQQFADQPSIDQVRAHFPALTRTHNRVPVAYFDGPGGTQVPRAVVDAMADYLLNHNANTHWNYPTSGETDEILAHARLALADFIGGGADEIVFGANATTLAFHVSRAFSGILSSGDEVVITELDHHANVGPWQALVRESGCTLRVVKMNTQDGTLDWNDFERNVHGRTKLVAVGAASNALGTMNDVAKATRLARAVGAYTFVDAVHYVPHKIADVRALDCDFLVCSAYKFYGPHLGVLWCRRQMLESLPFAKLLPAPNTAPDRAETGTQNHEGIAGVAAAVEFLASLGLGATRRQKLSTTFEAIHERCAVLLRRLWTGLSEIDGVILYGPSPDVPRTPTVAFTVCGVASSHVATRLAERGVFVSHGDFYAATVVERLGLGPEGLVRAGCACYTTAEEVERLIEGVREIALDTKR
jgi:cysteine desulfurase family protein (TIGR01976 family)